MIHEPGEIDLAGARRWRSTLRRVDRVEIHRVGAGGHGILHGVGHRRAVRRRVSLPTARGLARLGVPVVDRNVPEGVLR